VISAQFQVLSTGLLKRAGFFWPYPAIRAVINLTAGTDQSGRYTRNERRGVVEFEPGDSHDLKIQYVYRLLVHDKEIAPLPPDQVTLPNMRRRLAKWVSHKLPADHALLN
jgi:hypothetical protein